MRMVMVVGTVAMAVAVWMTRHNIASGSRVYKRGDRPLLCRS